MDAAKAPLVETLKTNLEEISSYDPLVLAEGEDLGSINFRAGEMLFAQTIELASEFRPLPLDLLPLNTLQQLQGPILNLKNSLSQVKDFTLGGRENPEAQRDKLLKQVQTHHDEAFLAVTPHLAYLSLKSAQVQETMRRSAELLKETEARVDDSLQKIAAKLVEIESIVKAARDAAAKVGVAQFATKFEEISQQHVKAGGIWLWATGAIGIATVLVAVGFIWLFPPIGEMKDPATVQRIITKLVVISVFYFAALWSARNYRAHRHLSVLNEHRQNALSTFETFVKAANDDQTKNAVLLEATHCIFSSAHTGYLGADEENPSSRVIEILKTVGGTSLSK